MYEDEACAVFSVANIYVLPHELLNCQPIDAYSATVTDKAESAHAHSYTAASVNLSPMSPDWLRLPVKKDGKRVRG